MRKIRLRTIKVVLVFGIVALVITGCGAATSTIEPTRSAIMPTPTWVSDTFSGYYVTSFEVSSFVPCSMDETPGYGKGYWLGANPTVRFYDLYEKTIAKLTPLPTPDSYEGVIVFIRFKGEITPTGTYGHLGQYLRQVTVTEVLEMAPKAPDQCAE